MDWKFWLALIPAVIQAVFVTLDYFGVKPKSMQAEDTKRSTVKIMALLMLFTWGAVAYDLYDRSSFGQDPIRSVKEDVGIIREWGLVNHEEGKPHQVQLFADGKRILSYNPSFQSGYRLALICFRTDGTQDYLDIERLQKSALYDIQNTGMRIILIVDEEFVEEWKQGMRGTNYFLFLVPRGVEMNQFSTIRQAQALGTIQLAGRAGPP
jgi:hypothetical protein